MEFEQLLELIRTVSASALTEFKYEEKGTKICMEKKNEWQMTAAPAGGNASFMAAAQAETAGLINMQSLHTSAVSLPLQENEKQTEEAAGELIISPLVGTFYTAPQEDAEAFVKVGDTVKKGQTLAIIEAMKLMNEIESEADGTVTEILAENGQAVEYGQPLFRIA